MPQVVRVQGVAELRRALQAMSKEAPKELEQAGKRAGNIVKVEAYRRAPRGKHEGGGSVIPIASSIGVVQRGRVSAAGDHYAVSVTAGGSRTPHAAPTEFGGYIARRGFKGINRRGKREAHKRGHTGILTHVKRQPYLLPAIAAKIEEVVAAYGFAIDAVVAKFESTN